MLVIAESGELFLVEATRDDTPALTRLRVFHDASLWAHRALVGDRLYLRTEDEAVCLLLR